MVRVKYRYLVLKYEFDDSKRYTITPLTFADIVKELVFVKHGEIGLMKLGSIFVIECLPISSIFLFKIPRGALDLVKGSVEECTNIGGCICKLDIIFVSGCVKNVRKKLVGYLKSKDALQPQEKKLQECH